MVLKLLSNLIKIKFLSHQRILVVPSAPFIGVKNFNSKCEREALNRHDFVFLGKISPGDKNVNIFTKSLGGGAANSSTLSQVLLNRMASAPAGPSHYMDSSLVGNHDVKSFHLHSCLLVIYPSVK